MISATVYGHIGKDPELKTLENGDPILKFSVASNSTKKDGEPTWVRVTIWGNQAKTLQPMLHKGDRVCVCGCVELRTWKGNDGPVTDLEMRCDRLDLVEKKDESAARGESGGQREERREERRDDRTQQRSSGGGQQQQRRRF